MTDIQRRSEILSKEERTKTVGQIIAFFQSEREETLGVVAATEILDLFLQDVGPTIYNKAIDDARVALKKELEEWDFTLDQLRK